MLTTKPRAYPLAKPLLICLFAISFSLLLTACETGEDSSSVPPAVDEAAPSEEALRKAIFAFNDAFARGNAEEIAGMITDDYRHTNGTAAAIDRASWLSYINQRQKLLEGGELIVHDYAIEELGISIHGRSAIVTGRIIVDQSRQGERSEQEYRITNVWVIENGTWKRAGFHDGKIDRQ